MTEQEKKEFEEFLKWKKERESQKEASEETQDKKSLEPVADSPETVDGKQDHENNDGVNISTDDKGKNPLSSVAFIVIVIVVILGLFLYYVSKQSGSSNINLEDEIIEEVDSVTVGDDDSANLDALSNTVTTKTLWNISTETDEMTDSKNIWASIKSDNYITQDFPYDGCTYARITVRYMKKYGYDVLIQITQGQINGRSYYGTDYITARFDEGQPKKYYFNESSDGDSEVIFLRNVQDFIKKCKQSTNIKIDIPLYQAGRPVFTFKVDEPLVWPEN